MTDTLSIDYIHFTLKLYFMCTINFFLVFFSDFVGLLSVLMWMEVKEILEEVTVYRIIQTQKWQNL